MYIYIYIIYIHIYIASANEEFTKTFINMLKLLTNSKVKFDVI